MTGAFGIEKSFLKGRILVNIDSIYEGDCTIGSAGGMDTKTEVPISKGVPIPSQNRYKLTVKGMLGGHS